MRMSIHKSDPGYHKRAQYYRVFIDDVELSHCFTADEDRGYALVHQTDENGNVLLNEYKDEILTEKRHGKIDIKRVQ